MLRINREITIPENEIEMQAVRARGAGGQKVNKVATAIHLRFDVPASSLPDQVKTRLLQRRDSRITAGGVVVIKAQNHRTQERNRMEARDRLARLVRSATHGRRKRIPTRPGRAAKKRRVQEKRRRGQLKKLRSGKIPDL